MAKYTYTCNCPDATKKQSFQVNSSFESYAQNRSWEDSSAGVDNKTTFCKHVYAVKLLRGELPKSEIPTDIPLGKAGSFAEESQNKEQYQQGYAGHDFRGGWGVAQPRKWKGG